MSAATVIPMKISTFRYPGGPLDGRRGVVMAFAIGVDGRWILMDTGIGTGNAELVEVYAPETRPIGAALKSVGVEPAWIEGIVNSHLHFDHCGQNALFPQRPIWVQSSEWAAAQLPDYTIPEWVDFPGARYELIDGQLEVLPGVTVVPTPGHTPGHQSVVVDTPDGPVVLAGQACYAPNEWSRDSPAIDGHTSAWDQPAYRASLDFLRQLDPITCWFAHSCSPWRRT